jgi:hypothetical protein
MLFGQGCACGLPAGHIDPAAIDATVIGHLATKYRASGNSVLGDLFGGDRPRESLSELIGDVLEMRRPLEVGDVEILCSDLEPIVQSLEELGGGRARF